MSLLIASTLIGCEKCFSFITDTFFNVKLYLLAPGLYSTCPTPPFIMVSLFIEILEIETIHPNRRNL